MKLHTKYQRPGHSSFTKEDSHFFPIWVYIKLEQNLGFAIRMILAIFLLQDTPILPIKFRVNGPFCSGEKFKIDFQNGHCGGHLVFRSE